MKRYNILVFPCGSEIGLEIYRSLRYSAHINLIGGSSVDDHGKYVFDNYLGGIPDINSEEIIPTLKKLVIDHSLDAIYPTMDKVIWKLKSFEKEINCKIISSDTKTTEICVSKLKTYEKLKGKVKIPVVYNSPFDIENFPVFIKPDIGYGSRGVKKVINSEQLSAHLSEYPQSIVMEYLPGDEYTVDCFTDRHGELRFVGPRLRKRIMNGISVNTIPITENDTLFRSLAETLNKVLVFRGAWFFQVKRDKNENLTLLEIASRLGGSSSLFRGLGVNFALLSVFDAFNLDVKIQQNSYHIELDRALDNKFKIDINYSNVYVDFDDCLIVNDKINTEMISYLLSAVSSSKKIILITKHTGDLAQSMKKYRISALFDEIIHISKEDEKYKYIQDKNSIFIDDSFSEREKIRTTLGIPVFSPDMVECLY